ncbi:MAG: ThuA domain-containing protein [Bryobacterales bacterium]|nr:ThuA domain-containing protein [Bryobacterales bacterium]
MTETSRRSFLLSASGLAVLPAAGPNKRVVFVAGIKTHGFGQHAHNTGCQFLARWMRDAVPGVETAVHPNGWPPDPAFFDGASAVVVYMDGGDAHPILPHLETVDRLMRRGAGLAVLHYALVVPKGQPGSRFLEWIGGYYETWWSVNPFWTARFEKLPQHPITRGVRPFAIRDEWYYHMRFVDGLRGITPILTAKPPESTREGKFGPHSGNEFVRARKGRPEHTAWAYERPGGGRGFGFTGAHYHWSFLDDDYRTLLLNALAWIAGIEVPAAGFRSKTPDWADLLANQEGRPPEGFNLEEARKAIHP